MNRLTRRDALTVLAAIPLATRARAAASQVRATSGLRVVFNALHGLLIAPDGSVQTWARPGAGEAGDWLTGVGRQRPVDAFTLLPVPDLSDVVSAAAGPNCSFVIRADGSIRAWGVNAGNGLLGTTPRALHETTASSGPNADRPMPLAVTFEASDVSCHTGHVLALTRDGRVFAWGAGDKGQLGIGPMPIISFRTRSASAMPYVPFPVEIATLTNVAAISAGPTHSLALMKDGTVRAWGENRWGQVGDGTTVNRATPTVVSGVRNAVAIAAGGSGASAALLADGTVMTWGNRFGGWLGRTPENDNRADPTPTLVPGVNGIKAIAAGLAHMLAVTDAGTIISWGDGSFGAIGRGRTATPAPAPIRSLTGVRSVAASGNTSMAMLASGRIMTWGAVRPWTRPPEEGSYDDLSSSPILLWLDGLEQP